MNRSKSQHVVRLTVVVLSLFGFLLSQSLAAAIKDTPFDQPVRRDIQIAEELKGARFIKMEVDRNSIVYVLTDRGVARVIDDRLALDRSFRPLIGTKPLDIGVTAFGGDFYYLFSDRLLSNGRAGKPFQSIQPDTYSRFSLDENGGALLLGDTQTAFARDGQLTMLDPFPDEPPRAIASSLSQAWLANSKGLVRFDGARFRPRYDIRLPHINCLELLGADLLVGTTDGYAILDAESGLENAPVQTRLPATNITALIGMPDGIWAGTDRGVWHCDQILPGQCDYFASRRWLADDFVVDLKLGAKGDLWVLNRSALNKIEFRKTTLADKADYFDRKIRQRHIRHGFCSELLLRNPGDITSAEMIDSDNDGTWSNYYMASQAFRFAVTKDSWALFNAWETFEAMERLESITKTDGFIARSFERRGFKFADPERWREASDPQWDWKGHTSSDEIAAHTFGCAVLYETSAESDEGKARIVGFYDRILDHIVRHNFYLVDVDGKPTLWGRWNPEYVNWFPHTIVDRRLNSAEIIAALQFGFKITGKEIYRQKAYELINQHGYLTNILSSMKLISETKGFIHQGNDMGDEWNHSDDLLSFVTYWVLYRFAFTPELQAKYAAAIRDHWDIEKIERSPLWNFVLASTGDRKCDLEGAMWTLRKFPLDLINWTVRNSNRNDLTRLSPNFRHQEMSELLPPTERHMMRWNGNPFQLDGGDGGRTELAGDEFLLPYWMGRYLKLID